jgi:dTDP-4-amino-4,6-dideoxygalactose transaminase
VRPTEDQLDADLRGDLAAASGTDPADWHLVSKGRHAMMLVLAALPAGEVVNVPLTCLTAVAPTMSAGHRPRYVDVDPDTLALDPALLPQVLDRATRAVIAQHTFGAAAPLDRVAEVVGPGVMLMEDSCHCLGEMARGQDGEPVADVSVHSFGLEKMLPTSTGAAVWVNPHRADRPWHGAVLAALSALGPVGVAGSVRHLVSRPAQRVARRLGRAGAAGLALASRAGLADQVIMTSELSGDVAGTPTGMTGPVLAQAARAMPGLQASRQHRRAVAAVYRDGLASLRGAGVSTPAELDVPGRSLVRYPVLMGSTEAAERTFAALQQEGLVPGRWYRPLLFPGPADWAPFAYDPATCPVSEDVSARILNLPTAPFVTDQAARRAVEVVAAQVG